MKTNLTILSLAIAAVTSCGTSAQFANSGQRFNDGIYYPSSREEQQQNKESDKEVAKLAQETKEAKIFLYNDSGRDTIVVPGNKSVRLKFNKPGNTTITVLDNSPKIDLYMGYAPYTYWGYSWYSPWYYNSWYYDPWYQSSSWYYSGVYNYWNPYWGTYLSLIHISEPTRPY